MADWAQPMENSVDALRHGMEFSDGVEFDLRMSVDGDLVIYHDEFIPGRENIRDRCIESLSTSELRSKGIVSFEEIISDSNFSRLWQDGGKTVDIEVKLPHPVTKIETDGHLSSILKKIELDLDLLDLPKRSTLVTSFSPRIGHAAKIAGVSLPVARLVPHIRAWGRYWRVKRTVAAPNFARTSFQGVSDSLRKEGMESIGMALEYLVGWTRFVGPKLPVGLAGRGLKRFQRARSGMGVFVWPAPLEYEDALIDAGVSLVSDEMDPTKYSKPDGSPRWPRPGSQPLDSDWISRLDSATSAEYPDLLGEAAESLPLWPDLNKRRKAEIITEQASRMVWPGGVEKWFTEEGEGLPWGSPRIIGHRGAGSTHSR